jgi:hypothetical protein
MQASLSGVTELHPKIIMSLAVAKVNRTAARHEPLPR